MSNLSTSLSREHVIRAIKIWTHASITLTDIRHQTVEAQSPMNTYCMPSSMFIFSSGGPADIWVNEKLYSVERFGVFHGGKGTQLSIQPKDEKVDFYSLFYKAENTPFYQKELRRLLKKGNPFQELFGFAPQNPLFLQKLLRKMYKHWSGATSLDRFYGKTHFYQFVYEIYAELEQGAVQILQPNVVSLVKHYIGKHFNEVVSMQEIAELFHVSTSHLSRLFKKQEGISPQEFLIQTRIEAAKRHLLYSQATIREIAIGCGFSDDISLMRTFKNICGMTPSDYRKINAVNMHDYEIENDSQYTYSNNGLATLGQLVEKGENVMLGTNKSKALMATVLSLLLMLGACSTPATNNNSNTSSNVQTTEQGGTEAVPETRVIQTENGEVEVPANPQRIFVQSVFSIGDVLPFTENIVGIDANIKNYWEFEVWQGQWGILGNTSFIKGDDLEGILTLNPDLIIGNAVGYETEFEQYSKIAPTVLYETRDKTIQEKMDFIGELLGMPERAEELKKDYERKVEQAKKRLVDANLVDKKIVFIQGVEGKQIFVHAEKNRAFVYTVLGMNAPEKIENTYFSTRNPEADGYAGILSKELLPEYLADADIIAYTRHFEDSVESLEAGLAKEPLWTSIPAVQQGNVYYYSNKDTLLYSDYSNQMMTLDTFVDALLELPIAKQ